MMPTRTAKSCRSDAPMPASSLREEAQATVSNKPGHRGEHEVSRKTIARGMPGRSGVTVVTTLVCLFFYTRGCGSIVRPAFPAPSDFSGDGKFRQTSRERRGEIAKPCLYTAGCLKCEALGRWPGERKSGPSLRGAQATKQSTLRLRRCALLRFARNDGLNTPSEFRPLSRRHRPRKRAIQYSEALPTVRRRGSPSCWDGSGNNNRPCRPCSKSR